MEIAELVVQEAQRKGATEAEAYVQRFNLVQIEGAPKIQSFKNTISTGMGLRVALGKRIAFYSTSALSSDEVEKAVDTALKIARVAPEDPNWRNMNTRFGESSAQDYYDRTLEAIDYSEVVEDYRSAAKSVQDFDSRVHIDYGTLYLGTYVTAVADSYGTSGERRETGVVGYFSAKAKDAGQESGGGELTYAKHLKRINLEKIASTAVSEALAFLKARPIGTEKLPVIIRNKTFARITSSILSPSVNAEAVQQGRSPLADKLGSEVAADQVTVVDDALLREGWATRPFDDEGHPTQTTKVIEKGVLMGYLYDSYTANKEGTDSTGNASRYNSYSNPPRPAASNFVVKPGTTSPEQIIEDTQKGIYVAQTIGEWLSDYVSGKLNATITHGYVIRNGELAEPVKGVVLSGNYYELLRDGIEIVGNDLDNDSSYYSPTIKARELTVAGK